MTFYRSGSILNVTSTPDTGKSWLVASSSRRATNAINVFEIEIKVKRFAPADVALRNCHDRSYFCNCTFFFVILASYETMRRDMISDVWYFSRKSNFKTEHDVNQHFLFLLSRLFSFFNKIDCFVNSKKFPRLASYFIFVELFSF